MSHLSLLELNTLVEHAVSSALPDFCWVEAELMGINEVRGHCFLELVQKDLTGATPVARASAKCWRTQWKKVGAKFLRTAGSLPSPGMKLLLKVSANFHPAYGYSLIVNDIDPTYTLGDMARRRREIIQRLKEEGVYDMQRELRLPFFCQRIAVISSATAAGYGDFRHQLETNGYGLRFEVELFPAVMQGEQVEGSIIAQLDAINARQDDFDCVVIIRGGGATSDMSGFDTLALAENVANFPLPVITGIGHERDECVLDLISFLKVKTPTAAAAFLISHLSDALSRVEAAQERIVSGIALTLEREAGRMASLSSRVSAAAQLLVARQETRIGQMHLRLVAALQRKLADERHRLQLMTQRITSLDPKLLLKRGYSMTLLDGKPVKDASELATGAEIETVLAKGKIKSTVK